MSFSTGTSSNAPSRPEVKRKQAAEKEISAQRGNLETLQGKVRRLGAAESLEAPSLPFQNLNEEEKKIVTGSDLAGSEEVSKLFTRRIGEIRERTARPGRSGTILTKSRK